MKDPEILYQNFWCIVRLDNYSYGEFLELESHVVNNYDLAIEKLFNMKKRELDKDFYLCKTVGKAVMRDGIIVLNEKLE